MRASQRVCILKGTGRMQSRVGLSIPEWMCETAEVKSGEFCSSHFTDAVLTLLVSFWRNRPSEFVQPRPCLLQFCSLCLSLSSFCVSPTQEKSFGLFLRPWSWPKLPLDSPIFAEMRAISCETRSSQESAIIATLQRANVKSAVSRGSSQWCEGEKAVRIPQSLRFLFSPGFRRGRCKWFNVAKGWGFITPEDDPEQEVFVHQVRRVSVSAVKSSFNDIHKLLTGNKNWLHFQFVKSSVKVQH